MSKQIILETSSAPNPNPGNRVSVWIGVELLGVSTSVEAVSAVTDVLPVSAELDASGV